MTGGTLWFYVAHRTGPRVKDWLTFCLMFRTTTLRWKVGGHRGDIEPGELAAAVGPSRIPEVGEVEAELCSFNPVVI